MPSQPLGQYVDLIARQETLWKELDTGELPYGPVVTVGWDPSPRWAKNCGWPPPNIGYPYTPIIVNNMGLAPVGLALIRIAVAEQKRLEAQPAAAQVIDGIGAGAAEVPDGFIGRFGHIDRGEFAGAEKAGDGAGIPFIGFEGRTRLLGNERWSGDQTGHMELLKPTGTPDPPWEQVVQRIESLH